MRRAVGSCSASIAAGAALGNRDIQLHAHGADKLLTKFHLLHCVMFWQLGHFAIRPAVEVEHFALLWCKCWDKVGNRSALRSLLSYAFFFPIACNRHVATVTTALVVLHITQASRCCPVSGMAAVTTLSPCL